MRAHICDAQRLKNFSRAYINTLALSYFRVSRQALQRQLNLWSKHLPDVTPFYAVKCNNDPVLMKWMAEHRADMGFDCASLREMDEVLPMCKPKQIIYAQPCKKIGDIELAQMRGVQSTVVDSVEEVEKLGAAGWTGEILVRMLVRDGGSKQPFGKKFGAPVEWLPRMYDVARFYKLNMTGFSFHVGSECEQPRQYEDAIADCAVAAEVAKRNHYGTEKIDIGGGFIPDEIALMDVAAAVEKARYRYFQHENIKWIAEPGRFLAAPTHILYTTVIGKKPVWPAPLSTADPAWRITIDESVYGSFSNIPFDHQKPVLRRLRAVAEGETRRPTIVFGRTCDSGDCIGTDIPMYEVQEGDVLEIPEMGAYTTVTASEFNGFPKPHKFYELK